MTLDGHKVGDVNDTQTTQHKAFIHISSDADDRVTFAYVKRKLFREEPIQGIENDVPEIDIRNTKPEKDIIPPLLMIIDRSMSTELGSEPYRGPQVKLVTIKGCVIYCPAKTFSNTSVSFCIPKDAEGERN